MKVAKTTRIVGIPTFICAYYSIITTLYIVYCSTTILVLVRISIRTKKGLKISLSLGGVHVCWYQEEGAGALLRASHHILVLVQRGSQVLDLGQASLVLYIVIVLSIATFIVYWKSHAVAKALQLPMH